jgi:RND family efflux transporter MFP subunit
MHSQHSNWRKKAYETAVKTRDTSLRQTDASVALAAIRYDTAAGNAGRLSIIAPFSGVIITKNIDTGSLVNPGMSLFVLGDTSTLIVKAEMTGEQQSTLRIWQDIPLVISGQTITGTLKSLWAGPDPITHLYKAEITLPKNHPTIALGDIVDVIVNRVNTHKEEPKKEIVVPFSALKNLGQETYAVYILTPDIETPHAGIVHERIVKIGATNETSVTIVDGLTLGETIVSRGTLMIEDGDYVQEATDAAIEVPAEESNS